LTLPVNTTTSTLENRNGILAGFDALVIYAGSVYLVEIKLPGKPLNAREIEAHLEIRWAGGVVNVIHDIDEALHMVGWSRL
jgi:hypothetical protein